MAGRPGAADQNDQHAERDRFPLDDILRLRGDASRALPRSQQARSRILKE
jgi:hypothetical protein